MLVHDAYEILYDYIFDNFNGEDRKVCLRALDVLSGGVDTLCSGDDEEE